MRYFKFVLPAILLALSTSVNASLIDNDTYTTDTDTGLNWLDMSFTDGQSYRQVSSMINGGSLDGWRFATSNDLNILLSNILSTPTLETDVFLSAYYQPMKQLFDFMGPTHYTLGSGFFGSYTINIMSGLIASDGVGGEKIRDLSISSSFLGSGKIHSVRGGIGLDVANTSFGSFLIQSPSLQQTPSTVPVPAAAWLFGSALLGFFGFSRRKANA